MTQTIINAVLAIVFAGLFFDRILAVRNVNHETPTWLHLVACFTFALMVAVSLFEMVRT